jgi:hypothetical protein
MKLSEAVDAAAGTAKWDERLRWVDKVEELLVKARADEGEGRGWTGVAALERLLDEMGIERG